MSPLAYTGRLTSVLTEPELTPKLDTVESLVNTKGLIYITEADSAGQAGAFLSLKLSTKGPARQLKALFLLLRNFLIRTLKIELRVILTARCRRMALGT